MIRLTVPSIEDDDLRAVREVLRSGYLVQGRCVEDFERRVAEMLGAAHAVALSSGTAALHLSLLAAGVSPGDVVITTAYSWIATANVIEFCGARPVFVDIDPRTFNLAPPALGETLRSLSRDAGRVKAVLPVHTFGQMADMPAITALAAEHGLAVIEDAACAMGATQVPAGDDPPKPRQAGTIGRAGAFSFHPRKALTTGEGGMCVTDEADLARSLRILRNHGLDPRAEGMDFARPGLNYRMTEFQAAMGASQLPRLERALADRAECAGRYDKLLADTPLQIPAVAPGNRHVYQSYVVLLPGEQARRRGEIITALKARGIETAIGTIHMPLTGYYSRQYGYKQGDFPVTDDIFARSLALPMHEKLTQDQQQQVAAALLKELGNN